MTPVDRYLERCVELAEEAADAGDRPFGSVLVAQDGTVLAEDRNRTISAGDPLAHPEIALVRWAVAHLSAEDRAATTVYTSGEHCAMCSAAHGWAGLGRIVYIHSAEQLAGWAQDLGVPPQPVASIPIRQVVPGLPVDGPVEGHDLRMRDVHRSAWTT